MPERLVAGCMSGTSCDGIDVALLAIDGAGLELRAELRAARSEPLGALGERLRAAAAQEALSAGAFAALRRDLAEAHRRAVVALGAERIELVAVHGQTVFHRPPLSWQLIDLAALAQGLGCAVVGDLRAADIAAGGQGAPITPLADWLLLRSAEESRAVVNLGGFCNFSWLPASGGPEQVRGADIGVCNLLLDGLARALLHADFDRDGAVAASAAPDAELSATLQAALRAQQGAGRSLGSGDELLAAALAIGGELLPAVRLASAVSAIAAHTGEACASVDRVLLAGGGLGNRALAAAIARACAAPVEPSDAHGVPARLREAMAMAVLGALCQDAVPITLPQVTGVARAPLAGVWAGR